MRPLDSTTGRCRSSRDWSSITRITRRTGMISPPALSNWGELEKDRDRPAVAERLTREAIQILEALCQDDPRSLEFPVSLARCYSSMGDIERERDGGDRPGRTWYDRAVKQLEKVLAKDPHQGLARRYLQDVLWGRAQLLARGRAFREALADCERALTVDEDRK